MSSNTFAFFAPSGNFYTQILSQFSWFYLSETPFVHLKFVFLVPAIFGLQLSLEMAKTLALDFDSTIELNIESTVESTVESTIESTQVGKLSCESRSSKLHLVHTTLN